MTGLAVEQVTESVATGFLAPTSNRYGEPELFSG